MEDFPSRKEGDHMLHEFLGAAFPWIVIGLFAAFACAFLGKKEK